MDIAAKLDEARALIEGGWCQGNVAKDVDGSPVCENDARAACFCTFGAMCRVTGKGLFDSEDDLEWHYLKLAMGADPIDFNDSPGRTQAEVVEAFRKAAEIAREQQS